MNETQLVGSVAGRAKDFRRRNQILCILVQNPKVSKIFLTVGSVTEKEAKTR